MVTDRANDTDLLLAAGWIARAGTAYTMTEKGKAALRRGRLGGVPGELKTPIDSTRARLKPAIKKQRKRHA